MEHNEQQGYQPRQIEAKWQQYWKKNKTFKTTNDEGKDNFYALDMFPYPSGSGLHVGHPVGYMATDIVSRYKRMKGYNVLHPIGWDAFGLPAEQYALQTGRLPQEITTENINNFRRQLQALGFSYDWEREVNTTDPSYVKWTQWIFIQLYKMGLAYVAEVPVNWCEALGTVLANEEVINGRSERGGHLVVRKPMKQWMLKITAYAERLLGDLEDLDWPENLKEMQRNWIGKSIGAEINFGVSDRQESFSVFTTCPETLFGVTYCVLAPEHALVKRITTSVQQAAVDAYIAKTSHKTDLERTDLSPNKTGVFTGAFAVHPISGKNLPIWIADYVLSSYGTGAVMAVPAHDERDGEFASKFNLPILTVISEPDKEQEGLEAATLINSDFLDGLSTEKAREKVIAYLENEGKGKWKTTYRLRDWLFSRQRYWGEPIPVLFYEDGSMETIPEEQLPLLLPEVKAIYSSGTGESPLANIGEWKNVVDSQTGRTACRETNTMPQWAGSCWYYLRYLDPHNENELCSLDKQRNWLPVDLYIGGAEHAVLHLLYARFWHKVLYDLGVVQTKEPFQKLVNQGMILGPNHEKMSKSRGNVISPDQIIVEYGADALRMYEMFMGPLEASKPWNSKGIEGVFRFLSRVWRLYMSEAGTLNENITFGTGSPSFRRTWHNAIQKIEENYESLRFNTAISQMMIFVNEAYKEKELPKQAMEDFVQLLAPIAPHLAEELWQQLGHSLSITYAAWPQFDPDVLKEKEIQIVVQVNGKIIDRFHVPVDLEIESTKQQALALDKIQERIVGKTIHKVIVVKNKLVNIVVN